MKMLVIAATVLASAFAFGASEASAGSLINVGGNSRGLISLSPNVNVLNNSNTNILGGLLSGNSVLNGSNVLSNNGGLLGLGILSGNNSGNSYGYGYGYGHGKKTRGCGCR